MFLPKLEPYLLVQALIAGCLSIGEILNGYDVGWAAPVIPKLQNLDTSPLPYVITDTQQSWIASAIYFGSFGAYIGGYSANKIGRKKAFIIGGILKLLSYILLTTTRDVMTVYIGRALVGTAMSWLTVVGIIYIGEIASSNIRGIILASMGVFHAIGSLLVYSVGPFTSYAGVGYVVMAVNVVYIVLCCFLPESPMYHVIKDDEDSARSALQYLGRDIDMNNELKIMMEKSREKQHQKQIWRELFLVKTNQMSFLITVGLAFFQQSSGIIAVVMFSTTIFRDAGSSIQPDIATIIIGATFALGACISPIFIEKYGRRILLLISTAGCCLSLAVLGVYFFLRIIEDPNIGRLGWLPLTCLVAAIFAYSVGLTIIPNTLSGELFTPKVRGLGPSIALICGWVSGFVSTTAFGYAVANLGGHVTFWIFAVVNGLAFFFVMAFVPETRGKSLMEIQMMLAA